MKFRDGNIVWVLVGEIWWPAEVYGRKRLPSKLVKAKKPIAYVKFFQHNTFMSVYLPHGIDMYHCYRKREYIEEGLKLVRSGQYEHLANFPLDVAKAEDRSSGDSDILEEFGYTYQQGVGYVDTSANRIAEPH